MEYLSEYLGIEKSLEEEGVFDSLLDLDSNYFIIKLGPKVPSKTPGREQALHTPANIAKAINVEAGELLEHFIWNEDFDKEKVSEELADVMTYCIYMAEALEININDVLNKKIDKIEKKYPIEKAKGNSKKYTEL